MSTPKPNNSGKKWTESDHNQLLNLVEKDYTIEDIALELERTVAAIRTKLLKETYELINTTDWTAEELSKKFKLPALDISNYQEREDEKKLNPPEKRVTRSQVKETKEATEEKRTDESKNVSPKRSFSSATKTRNTLIPAPKNPKTLNVKEINTPLPQTYNEQTLALLTEIRDSLRIIAAKK